MDKKYKQTKLNKYQIEYNIETSPTLLKPNKFINKEIIVNSFLQDTHNQKKTKPKVNLLSEKTIKEPKFNSIYLNMLEKSKEKVKINLTNNKDKINQKNNNISLNSFNKKRYKNYIEIQDNNSQNAQLTHNFTRSNSNKTSVVTSNESHFLLINSRNTTKKNETSFLENFGNNKIKRHKTVYIKKNLSVDRNINKSNVRYKNECQDYKNKYYNSNKKNDQKYYTPSSITVRRDDKDSSNKNNTNNINSNVNIFNFGMQYSNSPHYFIRNTKMFDPYFNDYFAYNHQKINFNVNQYKYLEKVILIQSIFRGCMVRFNINYHLIMYKKFEFLHYFFINKFWNILKKNLLLYNKNKIPNCETESKLSISSISGLSALINSNLKKKTNNNNFNLKFFKETKETFSILKNNNNIKYYKKEKQSLNSPENNNKKIIWNKKMANKNNSLISNIIEQKLFSKNIKKLNIDKEQTILDKEKERYLKIIVTKKVDKSRMILLKSFLKFYYNVKLYNNKNINFSNNIEMIKHLQLEKLKKIIENKNEFHFSVLYKFFIKFKYKGILNYIQNNQYLVTNGGRLKNIEEDSFFIYEFSKQKSNNNNAPNRNIKSILIKIIKLRKIIYTKKQTKNDIIKKYFYKFRMAGIRHFMQIELKKKLVVKSLIIKMNKENNINNKENKNEIEIENKKYKTLNKLILKYNNNYINCCKNIFDRWNLRTKLFSLITKDKEKKKKRRIKKRNNKKLAANINKLNNNNINSFQISNNENNINKINNDFSNNSNIKINIQKEKNNINIINYDVGHPDSIIFMNNLKITDYFKITKFINKINCILTRKFYFFNIFIKNKKKEEENKNNINNDVDFFMEDSSESEN